jgi:D-alanyl-D-alanine dipeptidase
MSYEEKRVKVATYGTLPAKSPLLVDIPGTQGPRKLHKLAAESLKKMTDAIKRDLGIEFKAASAWRPHRWKSKQHYEETLISKYGSVQAGRKWLAYNSPHETGLAIDFGVGGLEPVSKTAAKQRTTPLHKWLVEHAHEYGWHPYKTEPWHWEYPLPKGAFQSGQHPGDDDDDGGDGDDGDEALSFGGGGGDDEADDFIEELDLDSVGWFSGEASDEQDEPAPAATLLPRAPASGPQSGEVEGEVEGGDPGQPFRVRWRVAWKIG